MRAALYVRISEADERSDSIERQEADLRALAEREEWTVEAILKDEGLSGFRKVTRPAYEEALEMLERGTVDVLAVWKLDRLTRQGLPALAQLVTVLDARPQARFVALKDGLSSDSPAWRLVAGVLAEAARMESENTRLRVRSRQSADRAAGRWIKTRPYGYLVDDAKKLQRHPEESVTVRRMVDEFLGGASLRAIASGLNDDAILTPRAARGERSRQSTWGLTTVRHILTSPVLAGFLPHNGEPALDEEGAPIVVTDEPIATEDERDRVLARLEGRTTYAKDGTKTGRGRFPKTMLGGLVRCAECGASMTYQGVTKRAYACASRKHGHPCRNGQVAADKLEGEIARRVLSFLATLEPSDDALTAIAERWASHHTPELVESRREALEALEAAEGALARVDDAYADGLLDRDSYRRQRERIASRVARASERVNAIPRSVDVTTLLDSALSREAWADADTDTRRMIVSSVTERVTYSKERGVEIEWAGETERPSP